VMEIARLYQIPQVTALSAATVLTTLGNPWFSRVAISDGHSVEALMRYLSRKNLRRIAVVYEDTEWGRGLLNYTRQAVSAHDDQIQLLGAVPLQRASTGMYPNVVAQALAVKADAIGLYVLQHDAIGLLRQIRSAGGNVTLFTSPANSSQDFLD